MSKLGESQHILPSSPYPLESLEKDPFEVSLTKGSKPGIDIPICEYFGFNSVELM
jgi:hypothetical protein